MKRLITLITIAFAALILSSNIYGQDRVNRVKLNFLEEGTKLTTFTGWGYDNEAGEWIDCQNFIENQKKYRSWTSASFVSHNDNNIISLQFKTVKYNDIIYHILVWEKWDGHYIYPEILEEWRYYKVKKFMIFSEDEMNKLHNLTNDVYKLEVPTITKGHDNSNIEDVDVIQTGLNKILEDTILSRFMKETIKIYKATDGSIRFAFGYKNIEKAYFEITEKEYNSLMTLK